jgi:hypothetical protein
MDVACTGRVWVVSKRERLYARVPREAHEMTDARSYDGEAVTAMEAAAP